MSELPEDTTVPSVAPERWETAVEDFAQVVAIGLDRAQDFIDVIGEFHRARPGILQMVAAAAGGTLVGAFLAGRRARHRGTVAKGREKVAPARRESAEDSSALDQTRSVAQQAAGRLAPRAKTTADLSDQAPRANRRDVRQAASAVKLVPIVLGLLRNPLVRELIWRYAFRAVRRR